MSRKKRRKAQQGQPATPDGFEFLDDRPDRAVVAPMAASPLATPAPAEARGAAPKKSVLSRARTGAAAKPVVTPASTSVPATATTATVVAIATDMDVDAAPRAPKAAPAVPAVPAAPPEPSLGQLLVRGREARHLSIEAASARTRIGVIMLEHLENDRFDAFAAAAYARGSLRAYASFLGLDVGTIMQRYDLSVAPPAPTESSEIPSEEPVAIETVAASPERTPRPPRRIPWPRIAAVAAGAAAAALGWGVFTLASRNPVELRPRAGLTQIEDELRRTRATPPPQPTETSAAPAPQPAEDTTPAAPRGGTDAGAAAPVPAPARTAAPPITDMVPVPPPKHDATRSAATPAGALVLKAIALAPCALRVQVDADAAGAALHQLATGESVTWIAQRSFRLTLRRGARTNLQLQLNGKPIATPAEGRTVRVDASTLEPAVPTPRRRRTSARTRAGANATRNAPAPRPAPSIEPHGGVPPPR